MRACLAKDPEERIQTAHDVKLQLQWIAEGGSQAGVPAPVAAARKQRERIAWIAAGVFGVLAVALAAAILFAPKPDKSPVRFQVLPPPGTTSMGWPKISPDGKMLAFQARDSSGANVIWVRPLHTTLAYRLQDTQTAGRPFWSPDSKNLAFFAEGKLRRVSAEGGTVQLVGEALGASDGTWGANDVVLFDGSSGDSIRGMPATGGAVMPCASFDRKLLETQHAWPCFLPDGKHFLFQAFRSGGGRTNLIKLGTIGSLTSVLVDSTESRAEFLPPNHIVYVRDGALLARRVSLSTWKPTGEPLVIGENAGTTGNTEAFSVAANGTVAYQSIGAGERLVTSAYDRAGHRLASLSEPDQVGDIAMSPDGTRLAMSILDSRTQKHDLWIRDVKRGTQTRFTFDPADEIWPTWSEGGDSIAFGSDRTGEYRIYVKPASGLSPEVMVPNQGPGNRGPIQWVSSRGLLAAQTLGNGGVWQSYVIPLADPAHVIPIATNEKFDIEGPRLSPDGRFVVYSSDESGTPELFVQPFPTATGRWQISTTGGRRGYWTKGGAEIVNRNNTGMLVATPIAVTPDGSINAGTPATLFSVGQVPSGNLFKLVPSADGQTFYLAEPASASLGHITPITVILNVNTELGKK